MYFSAVDVFQTNRPPSKAKKILCACVWGQLSEVYV